MKKTTAGRKTARNRADQDQLGLSFRDSRDGLSDRISESPVPRPVKTSDVTTGILKRNKSGAGVLRDSSYSLRSRPGEVLVPAALVREYQLTDGATIAGAVRQGDKQPELVSVDSICGLAPREFQQRTPYTHLTAINPAERFNLAVTGETSLRIIDLIAPIGKGTRGMIVSPPKAGKTMLLKQMATAIRADEPETRIIVLLIDERPEEVTDFRRSVEAEVLASSSDHSIAEHVELTEVLLAHIRVELECGRDVVVLVDSLTRMGRVFNLKGSGTKRTLSGGMEAGAMEIPRRFFGLARNIEHGGSVTIVATALINTGSRMDELIFEEFKGTGNSEIVLDRTLADMRIFPAINVTKSGTRKEERFYDADDIRRIGKLRRALADKRPHEAMDMLLRMIEKYPTNEELLQSIPVGKKRR